MNLGINFSKLRSAARNVHNIYKDVEREITFDDDFAAIPVKFNPAKKVRDVISLDGSYSVIWKSPTYPLWVIMVRTAILRRSYDPDGIKIVRVYDNFVDKIEIIDGNKMLKICEDEMEIISDSENFNPRMIETYIRNESIRSEENIAVKIANEERGIMILYDGSIAGEVKGSHGGQRAGFLENVINACRENDNVIVGLSKDSYLKRINNVTDDEIILEKYSAMNPGFTGYYLLNEGHESGIGTCFARLHQNAMKWFRVDFLARTALSIPDIIETIACYSQVNTLPGTPYPPLCAHEVAVKVRQLKEKIEDTFIKMLVNEGLPMEYIVKGLTNVNGNSIFGTFHDHLDFFTKLRKKIEL